jgi:hypothetical protein
MTRPPNNADKNKPKTVDSKTYWYPHHKAWGQHKALEIRLNNRTIMVMITLVITVQEPTPATTAFQ